MHFIYPYIYYNVFNVIIIMKWTKTQLFCLKIATVLFPESALCNKLNSKRQLKIPAIIPACSFSIYSALPGELNF